MRKIELKYIIYTLIIMCVCVRAEAQRIVRVDVDTVACLHDTVRIGVGRTSASEVEVRDVLMTITRAERAFLPDGVSCPPYGCSYRSHVTFSGAGDGVTIRNVNDIKYVRLNIEHSYIGDLYIGVVCPTGRRASLMNWSGNGSSDCDDEVPTGCDSWASGSNVSGGTYLGDAYDYSDYSYKCDSTRPSNAPGTGWDYCWSNNTASGYQYGSGDGRIYRTGNRNGYSIKASNAAQGRQFYKPDQSFTSLVGCPVDGTWYIEVIDAYSNDNGWVFEWELSLNEELVPEGGAMTGRTVLGDVVTQVNDSVWNVTSPANADSDTTIEYTVRVYGTGTPSMKDTVVRVHYFAQMETLVEDTLCAGETVNASWGPVALSGDWSVDDGEYWDTTVVRRLASVHGCDSVVTEHYAFRAPIGSKDTVLACQGDTILSAGTPQIAVVTDTTFIDTLNAQCGCDSVVMMTVTFHDRYDIYDTLEYCRNEPFIYEGVDYGGPTEFVSMHQTVWKCDSTVYVKLNMIDSAFMPHLLLSGDGTHWGEDTLLMGCEPYRLWLKDTSLLVANREWTVASGLWTESSTDSMWNTLLDTARVYCVTLVTTSVHGCRDTLTADSTVWVFAMPEASFGWVPLTPVLHDPTMTMRNSSTAGIYGQNGGEPLVWLWEIDGVSGTDTSSEFEPVYTWDVEGVNPSGDHMVKLIAIQTHNGPDTLKWVCADTAENTVTVVNDWLQFPTLVTPNGDGINDRWEVVNLVDMGQYPMNEIWIYNEWGVKVFHAKNVTKHEEFWDPNETNSPDGTYFYHFLAKNQYGTVKWNGTIEVLRN